MSVQGCYGHMHHGILSKERIPLASVSIVRVKIQSYGDQALKMISQILPQQSDTNDEETNDTTTVSLNGNDWDEDENEIADDTEPEVYLALQNEPDQSDDDKAADERATATLQRIYNIIEKPSMYDMCMWLWKCVQNEWGN